MFSDVGNIDLIKHSLTREAETADARLKKRQQHAEYRKNNQKKRKNGTETPINVEDTDENTISIDAIHDFLTNIAQSNASPGASIDQKPTELPEMFHAMASSKLGKIRKSYESAKAAGAYTHASHASSQTKTHNIDQSNKDSLGLQNISNKQLYTLIKDIELLRKRGTTTLSIRKTTNFLESLIHAVNEEKAALAQ